ncbi:Uncharacterized protein Fot_04936 [Forsythia ovata]|uniref:Uncharacterized protein n=1 Tax=Forsythia ovata TaxID=205694 RepID=A0ABD1WNR6_9LAMI
MAWKRGSGNAASALGDFEGFLLFISTLLERAQTFFYKEETCEEAPAEVPPPAEPIKEEAAKPKPEALVEKNKEEKITPPPAAEPPVTMVEKIEEKLEAVEQIKETIIHKVTPPAPPPPVAEECPPTPEAEKPEVEEETTPPPESLGSEYFTITQEEE